MQKKEARDERHPQSEGRTRRSREDILNRIVQAASEQFKQAGFAGTTTAAIARKAGVTEAQVFRHFGSKANLFRETVFKPLDQHLLNFTIRQAAKGQRKLRLEKANELYTTELQRFLTEHSELVTSLVVTHKYGDGSAGGVGEINSLRAYFEHSAAIMARYIAEPPRVDPKLAVRVTFAAVLGCVLFRDWVFPPGLASDKDITAAINQFVLEGISANYDRAPRQGR